MYTATIERNGAFYRVTSAEYPSVSVEVRFKFQSDVALAKALTDYLEREVSIDEVSIEGVFYPPDTTYYGDK